MNRKNKTSRSDSSKPRENRRQDRPRKTRLRPDQLDSVVGGASAVDYDGPRRLL